MVEEELLVKLGNIVFKLSTDTDKESVPMLIAQLNIKSDMKDWSGLFQVSLTLRVQVGGGNVFFGREVFNSVIISL